MPIIKIKDNESFDLVLRRFKRACEKAGILSEIKKREFYEKPTDKRKRAKKKSYRHIRNSLINSKKR